MRNVDGIAVFGEHDQATFDQIRRCAADAPVRGAALMADGHKGYSMPVGGVVAYAGAISPTGVGYDIGCFPGETRVLLLDGTIATLEELHRRGDEVWVYSMDGDQRIVPGRARCVQTRKDAELLQVAISGGEVIECTPDHQFLLRDGTYRPAQDLRRRDRLMPLYRMYEARDGYDHVHAGGQSMATHKLIDRYCNGQIEPRLHIHHADGNQFNNTPGNLLRQTKEEHDAHHAKDRGKQFVTEQFKRHRLEVLQANGFFHPDLLAKKQEIARSNGTAMTSEAALAAGNGQRGAPYLAAYNRTEAARERSRANARASFICECGETVQGMARIHWHRKKVHGYNHKVISVTPVERRADVYCLQVEEFHNFALAAGIFVHNCGNKAVRTALRVDAVLPEINPLLDRIFSEVSFGVGRKNAHPITAPVLESPTWSDIPALRPLHQLAASQLGTVGSGNHYVDLLADEAGYLWIACHFGSRGFGYKTASGFLNLAAGRQFNDKAPGESMDQPATLLSLATPTGQDYYQAMQLTGEYAYAGRDAVIAQVLGILGNPAVTDEVHNHHNFSWLERHDGEDVYVARKGATPAWPGQRGFVGGSMGDVAYVVEGTDSPLADAALHSTVHGAGRVMSRTEAAGKRKWGTNIVLKPGKVSPQMMAEWLEREGVTLRGGGLDESPHAYRRLPDVLAAQEGTVRVLHTLRPVGVCMAGADIIDPYKD